jgi:hypothetical protein
MAAKQSPSRRGKGFVRGNFLLFLIQHDALGAGLLF